MDYHPILRSQQPSRGKQRQFVRPQPEVDTFKYSLIPRIIADWNDLDEDTAVAATLESFKKKLLH